MGGFRKYSHLEALALGRRVVTAVKRAHPHNKKLAIMVDLDSTLFDEEDEYQVAGEGYMHVNKPIKALVDFCRNVGLLIIVITARPRSSTDWTKKNLKLEGVKYDKLIFSSNKSRWKESLSAKFGVQFVASVGDSLIDVIGSHSGVPLLLKVPGK